MALITCKDCEKEFSTDAKCCPHCGAKKPGAKLGCLPMGLFAFFGLIIIGAINSGSSPSTPISPCHSDWRKCADNSDLVNNYQGITRVQVECKEVASDAAKYGTPQFPFLPFGTFGKGTDYVKTGVVILYENDAQFQNGFGAMVHSIVQCTYDLNQSKVIDTRISEK